MKKVLKTILMGAVAFSLAMGVGCGTGENSSLEKESSKAEDSSSQNKRRQLRDKSDYGKVIALMTALTLTQLPLCLTSLKNTALWLRFSLSETTSQTRVQRS